MTVDAGRWSASKATGTEMTMLAQNRRAVAEPNPRLIDRVASMGPRSRIAAIGRGSLVFLAVLAGVQNVPWQAIFAASAALAWSVAEAVAIRLHPPTR